MKLVRPRVKQVSLISTRKMVAEAIVFFCVVSNSDIHVQPPDSYRSGSPDEYTDDGCMWRFQMFYPVLPKNIDDTRSPVLQIPLQRPHVCDLVVTRQP